MRMKLVAGNWKMNKSLEEGAQLVSDILAQLPPLNGRVVFATPYIHLSSVAAMLKGREGVYVAAQNCHQEEKGAYTGEISASMLRSVGVEYVLVGHSERRQYFAETNELLAKKVDIALSKGIKPIFCCGEPLDIREAGTHDAYVAAQLEAGLYHLTEEQFRQVVIAYEPIWAIGTGRTASSAQAQEMHAGIRARLAAQYGASVSDDTTILYGGSANAGNANDLFSQPDVDGGLIGGASLVAADFVTIAEAMG